VGTVRKANTGVIIYNIMFYLAVSPQGENSISPQEENSISSQGEDWAENQTNITTKSLQKLKMSHTKDRIQKF